MAPAFVMVDPFGVSDTPMRVIGRILENSNWSEVYISRACTGRSTDSEHPNFEETSNDDCLVASEWRQGIDLADGEERSSSSIDLYGSQLK